MNRGVVAICGLLMLGGCTADVGPSTEQPSMYASMANPGLGASASGNVEQAQYYYGGGYRRGYYGHRRGYYRSYAYGPRCYTQRIVRWDGRVRCVRRCR